MHAQEPTESASLPYQSSVPANKTSVPCYFYFNGFCNKGDRCSFLHASDDNVPNEKISKTASTVIDVAPLDNKMSAGKGAVSTPAEVRLVPSETSPKTVVDLRLHPTEDVEQLSLENMIFRSPSLNMAVSKSEEAAAIESDSLLPSKVILHSRADICVDESSEEILDACVEPEERWESSPGFDVLVDNISENLVHEDEQANLLALNGENNELNNHFLGYDFEDHVKYDPTYPANERLHENEIYGSFDCVDDVHVFDDVGISAGQSRGRMLDSLLSRKRKILQLEINDWRDVDLRDHLRKCTVIDGHQFGRSSRRDGSSRLLAQIRERSRRHGIRQRLHGRLVSGKNAIESLGNNQTLSNGGKQHHRFGYTQSSRARQHRKGKRIGERRYFSSQVARKSVSRDRFSIQSSTAFTGPKTLAQIKDEKKNVQENANCGGKRGYQCSTASMDFEGPKPLSEILKDKKRLVSVRDCSGSDYN